MSRPTPGAVRPAARPSAAAGTVRPRPPAPSATATPVGVNPAPPSVRLHIDHLVIDGFEVRDPRAFQTALEHELARRVAGDPGALAKLESSQRRVFESPALHGASSEALGVAMARRLIDGFEEEPT